MTNKTTIGEVLEPLFIGLVNITKFWFYLFGMFAFLKYIGIGP